MSNVSPSSHDVQYWSRLSDGANTIYIGLAVLVALATFLVYYFGSKAQGAKDNELKQVQAISAQKQASSATEIAQLHLQAAELNADAAKAKEGMAVAHAQIAQAKKAAADASREGQYALLTAEEAKLKQEQLKQENIQLSTRLNEAITEAQTTKLSLMEAQQKLTLAQLSQHHSLENVKQQQKPRIITPEQQKILTTYFTANPKGFVCIACVLGDNEALSYASQLDNILKTAGWNTAGVTQVNFSSNPVGLIVNLEPTNDAASVLPSANALVHGLSLAKLKFRPIDLVGIPGMTMATNMPSDQRLQLIVGVKPTTTK